MNDEPAEMGDGDSPSDRRMMVWGRELRYQMTVLMLDRGSMSIEELVDCLDELGMEVLGRASKTVSDALRWEMRRGRVVRVARGIYGPGALPRSTEWRIRRRAEGLRSAARTQPVATVVG